MPTNERDVLDEIRNIIQNHEAFASREQGKKFYDLLELPRILDSYVRASNRSFPAVAKIFGMSKQSLQRIIDGAPLSENMLFRIRNAIEYAPGNSDFSLSEKDDLYPGDWRNTNTSAIQVAISEVSVKLIFLKKVIQSSNILNSPDSPIDNIQVAQLIALLEATLAAIKGPQIDSVHTRGFFRWLAKLGKRALEKGIESKIANAIDGAVDAGADLLQHLSDAGGSSDLGSMIT